jgi:hypothetical protein
MRQLVACVLLAATTTVAMPAAQGEAPKLEDILRATGEYVKGYERSLALVSEESYTQQIFAARRTLQSDITENMKH